MRNQKLSERIVGIPRNPVKEKSTTMNNKEIQKVLVLNATQKVKVDNGFNLGFSIFWGFVVGALSLVAVGVGILLGIFMLILLFAAL